MLYYSLFNWIPPPPTCLSLEQLLSFASDLCSNPKVFSVTGRAEKINGRTFNSMGLGSHICDGHNPQRVGGDFDICDWYVLKIEKYFCQTGRGSTGCWWKEVSILSPLSWKFTCFFALWRGYLVRLFTFFWECAVNLNSFLCSHPTRVAQLAALSVNFAPDCLTPGWRSVKGKHVQVISQG